MYLKYLKLHPWIVNVFIFSNRELGLPSDLKGGTAQLLNNYLTIVCTRYQCPTIYVILPHHGTRVIVLIYKNRSIVILMCTPLAHISAIFPCLFPIDCQLSVKTSHNLSESEFLYLPITFQSSNCNNKRYEAITENLTHLGSQNYH